MARNGGDDGDVDFRINHQTEVEGANPATLNAWELSVAPVVGLIVL